MKPNANRKERVMIFQDRIQAGRILAEKLQKYRGSKAIALGLPRGGVVVAYEIAAKLAIPLDVIITHKVPAPGNPEYAIGAVAENGVAKLNEAEIRALGISAEYLSKEMENQRQEIRRRENLYRQGKGPPDLKGKTVLLIDDGVATGFTMMAAAKAVKVESPAQIIIVVPVGPRETMDELSSMADEIVVLDTPDDFYAVGMYYRQFEQTTDREVEALLLRAQQRFGGAPRFTTE
jgi:predicted phosphoribosyltransferase